MARGKFVRQGCNRGGRLSHGSRSPAPDDGANAILPLPLNATCFIVSQVLTFY